MNQYINGMNEIKLGDEQKKEIIRHAKQGSRKQLFPFKKAISALAVTCALAAVMIFGIPLLQNLGNRTANGFMITAYAADGSSYSVERAVEFPLGKYQVTMSSVPGFPLKILYTQADYILLTVSEGELLLWTTPDGRVLAQGKELEIKSGETVYWTPMQAENHEPMARKCTLLLKAYKDEAEIASNSIQINSDDSFTYTGRLTK